MTPFENKDCLECKGTGELTSCEFYAAAGPPRMATVVDAVGDKVRCRCGGSGKLKDNPIPRRYR